MLGAGWAGVQGSKKLNQTKEQIARGTYDKVVESRKNAPGRTRTGTSLRTADFKSAASTNSATGASISCEAERVGVAGECQVMAGDARSKRSGWTNLPRLVRR